MKIHVYPNCKKTTCKDFSEKKGCRRIRYKTDKINQQQQIIRKSNIRQNQGQTLGKLPCEMENHPVPTQ